MASYNKVMLIGRLATDPEMRQTPQGTPVVSFRLAVDRRRSAGAEKTTDFFTVVAWEKLAQTCHRVLNKGRLVFVEGRLQERSYKTPSGESRYRTEVIAGEIRFLDWPKEGAAAVADRSESTFEEGDFGGAEEFVESPFEDLGE